MSVHSSGRTDEQLVALPDDAGVRIVSGWVENCSTTQQLCRTASFRIAALTRGSFSSRVPLFAAGGIDLAQSRWWLEIKNRTSN